MIDVYTAWCLLLASGVSVLAAVVMYFVLRGL